MDELKPCDARDMWNAVTELEDMALHPSIKKRLSAETLAIAIAAISEKAGQNRRPATENKPLTLEELRQMEGQPVWVETMQEWRIVYIGVENDVRLYSIFNTISAKHVLDNEGRIYARKPEEEK